MATASCCVRGAAGLPTLVYLPGLHGDWSLTGPFGAALGDSVRWVRTAYGRSTSDDLPAMARSVLEALGAAGIDGGWLLAESFGSQVAWSLLGELRERPGFRVDGVILAGGFVRYPWPWLVGSAHAGADRISGGLSLLVAAGIRWARFHYGKTPEGRAAVEAFASHRREPGDAAAMTHRMRLIRDHDPRPVARAFRGPVWSLAGRWDLLVPMPWVHRWLRRECPGFRGAVTLGGCDHVVLASRPARAAGVVREIMGVGDGRRFVGTDARTGPGGQT